MSIYKGLSDVSKVFKGDVEISNVYVGLQNVFSASAYPSWFPANSDWENIAWFPNHEAYNPLYYVQFGIIRNGYVFVLRFTTDRSGTYTFNYNDTTGVLTSGSWVNGHASRQYAGYSSGTDTWTANTGSFIKNDNTLDGISKIFLLNNSPEITCNLVNIPYE